MPALDSPDGRVRAVNVKWSLRAVDALNLDPMRSSHLNVLMNVEQPYELRDVPATPVVPEVTES